jgi:hypothetical protein
MLEPLLLDLLEWVAKETRSYAEIMEAWRTSCPRLPVWEEAIDRGFLQRTTINGRGANIVLTEAGRRFLRDNRVLGGLPPPQGANPVSAVRESSRKPSRLPIDSERLKKRTDTCVATVNIDRPRLPALAPHPRRRQQQSQPVHAPRKRGIQYSANIIWDTAFAKLDRRGYRMPCFRGA